MYGMSCTYMEYCLYVWIISSQNIITQMTACPVPTDRIRMCVLLLRSRRAGPLFGRHMSPCKQDRWKCVVPENIHNQPFTFFLAFSRECFKLSLGTLLFVNLVKVIGALQTSGTTGNDFTWCTRSNRRRSWHRWTKII